MHTLLLGMMTTMLTLSNPSAPAGPGRAGLTLMPWPAKLELQPGKLQLDAHFQIAVRGNPHARLYRGATRMLRRLSGRTGLFFPQDFVTEAAKPDSARLIIRCQRPGRVALREDESYRLMISADRIEIDAATDLGALHALETMLQLLDADADGYFFPAIVIEDAPRFPWRGLLIDVCRHWLPIEVIKRNLDGMAAAKLNVLHLHLTEDQGFRIESKKFPKLHELGSDGLYFTQQQMREIIAYADERGIRVVPEFDMPGHVTSWLVGYPELASLPGPYRIERKYGVMDPSFDPSNKKLYDFLDTFLGEMAGLFPDPYLHIGGDENNGKHWDRSEAIAKFKAKHKLADNHALQTYFNKRLLKILTKHGKKMVGWDEILQPGMPQNIVIQSWRGREALVQSAKQGYAGILSNGYYIDLIQPTDFHYLNDPIGDDSPLTETEKQKILGGEATMWSELVTPENVDSRIWPRTAAIAERLWSPQNVRDVEDMYRRLEKVRLQLEELGLGHEKNYRMMLRRLAGGPAIAALKALVDVIEPIKIYSRHAQKRYTSYAPFTRVVDTARPDAAVARKFRKAVQAFLQAGADSSRAAPLRASLQAWQANHAGLQQLAARSPVLQEIVPQSENLAAVAQIGLQALGVLCDGAKVEAGWAALARERLAAAKKPVAETELMVVPAIEKLVAAVTEK